MTKPKAKKKQAKKPLSKEERKAKWAGKKPAPKEATAITAPAQKAEVMLSKPDAAVLQDGMRSDLQSAEKSVVEFAKKLDRFIRGQGWKALNYTGLTEWREKEMPFSEFYNAKSVMKLLAAGVSAERIEKLPLTNMVTLTRQLPPSKWTDEKVLKAAEGSVADFGREAAEQSRAMGMAVEELIARGFRVSKSLADNYDMALKIAELVDGRKSFEDRLETIVATYLNSSSEVPGKSRLEVYMENYDAQKAS